MAVGVTLSITLPTVGQAAWGGSLNTVLTAIVDAIEERVPASALDINANLDLQGNAAVNVEGLGFSTGDPLIANSIFMEAGELWVRDGNNDRVQITSGGSINVTVAGGFGGDYAGNGLAVFSSAGNLFTFTSAAGTYSVMESGQLRIHNGSSAGYTSLKPPSGQTGNIDLTFPTTLGSVARKVIEVDVTGTMALTQVPLLSGTVAAGGTFRIQGSTEISGNLSVQQTASFTAIRASREILHDNLFTMMISAYAGSPAGGTSFMNTTRGGIDLSTAGTDCAIIPIILKVGDIIDGYTANVDKNSASGKISWRLGSTDNLGATIVYGNHCTTPTAAADYTLGSSSLNAVVSGTQAFYVFFNGGGTSGDTVRWISVSYRRPTGSL